MRRILQYFAAVQGQGIFPGPLQCAGIFGCNRRDPPGATLFFISAPAEHAQRDSFGAELNNEIR